MNDSNLFWVTLRGNAQYRANPDNSFHHTYHRMANRVLFFNIAWIAIALSWSTGDFLPLKLLLLIGQLGLLALVSFLIGCWTFMVFHRLFKYISGY